MQDVKYIYNMKQAAFYIKHNIKPISVEVVESTDKICFKFDTKATEGVYNKWCRLCDEVRNNNNNSSNNMLKGKENNNEKETKRTVYKNR